MSDDRPPEAPERFTPVHIFDDPTPNAIIQNRIIRRAMEAAAQYTDMAREEQSEFADLVILIGRKMCSVYKHLTEYHAEEFRLVEKYSNPQVKHFEFSQVLYEEFDVFAVQIKSTLDHMVKVLRPIIGRSWTMYTFGDKGDKVLKGLKGNSPKDKQGTVKSMEFLLFNEAHKFWLDAVIESRDRMNHGIAGGLKIDRFAVLRRPDGRVELPMWNNEQKLGVAMDHIWANFFSFVEDFIILSLQFRISPQRFGMFKQGEPITSPNSPWRIVSKPLADALLKRLGLAKRV